MTKHHGMIELSDIHKFCQRRHKPQRRDRLRRMFPDLSPAYVPAAILQDLGRKGGPMDAGGASPRTDSVSVGRVCFGQFVEHDMTLGVPSGLGRVNDPSDTPNIRTPALNLDCIYGAGPDAHPCLYSQTAPFRGAKLLTDRDGPDNSDTAADPLQDTDPMRAAIDGDHRHPGNRILGQIRRGIIRFHNLTCERLHAQEHLENRALFEEARRITTWHYQWAVLHDVLPALCGMAVVTDILTSGRRFYRPQEDAFIPVEFAMAACRFGEPMVPVAFQPQRAGPVSGPVGAPPGHGLAAPGEERANPDWRTLFGTRAEKLGTKMATDLLALPFPDPARNEVSLATRNLLRGNAFLLPGGDRVAEAMGRPAAAIEAVMAKIAALSSNRIREGAPLWLYLLAEAELIGRETTPGSFDRGEGLGPVGARIVAEVLIGLLELDDHSCLVLGRNWRPCPEFDSAEKILGASNPALEPA